MMISSRSKGISNIFQNRFFNGFGKLDHLVDGITQGHASAVLAASIFHFGTYTIRAAKEHMAAAGIAVRLDG